MVEEEQGTAGVLGEDKDLGEDTNDLYKDIGTSEEDRAGLITNTSYNSGGASDDIAEHATITSGDSNVSENSLVRTQLQKILGEDSPLMNQTKSQAEVLQARMGRLGSTSGIGAAKGALIGKGLEIAQPDAQTYAQANLTAQQAKNQQALTETEGVVAGELAGQKAALADRSQALQNAYEAAIRGADQETSIALQDFQQQWQEKQNNLDREFDKWSTEFQVDAQQKEQLSARRAKALNEFQITQQQLLGDATFLDLGGPAIENLMNTMADGVISTVKYDMLAAGYEASDPALSSYLEDLAESLYIEFD